MSKESKVAVLVSIGVLVIFVLGVLAGRFLTRVPFDKTIGHWDRAQTLGALATYNNERESRAKAYLDPAKALAEMDGYGWAPANVPTPFVGVGPMPGKHIGISITSQQFRGTRHVAVPKPDGVFRVVLTGGSTAFSSGAPSLETTIGGQIEACLGAGAEVFTFANPAWASTQERIAIVNRLSELSVDVVVSLTGVNDVHWGVRGRDTMWFRTYWDQTFFEVDRAVFDMTSRPFLDPTVVSDMPIPVARLADNFEKNVKVSAYVLASVGAKYLAVLQPNLVTTTKKRTTREAELLGRLEPDRQRHYRDAFAAFEKRLGAVDAEGFAWFDLINVFDDQPEGTEVFLDTYHFGDRGNAIIGRAICERVKGMRP